MRKNGVQLAGFGQRTQSHPQLGYWPALDKNGVGVEGFTIARPTRWPAAVRSERDRAVKQAVGAGLELKRGPERSEATHALRPITQHTCTK